MIVYRRRQASMLGPAKRLFAQCWRMGACTDALQDRCRHRGSPGVPEAVCLHAGNMRPRLAASLQPGPVRKPYGAACCVAAKATQPCHSPYPHHGSRVVDKGVPLAITLRHRVFARSSTANTCPRIPLPRLVRREASLRRSRPGRSGSSGRFALVVPCLAG